MEVSYASSAAPNIGRNEDFVLATPGFVVVLDGVTRTASDTGCVHDVPWLVGHLSTGLASLLTSSPERPLADSLAEAITQVCGLHGGTCDLDNPDSPSATVSILRERDRWLDYLVLADSPLVLRRRKAEIQVIVDERIRHLADDTRETIRKSRNRSGGFWVASTKPRAAAEALSGSVARDDIECALVLTDGVSRLVEYYDHTWADLFTLATAGGPVHVIAELRKAEQDDPEPPFPDKPFDDATLAVCRFALAELVRGPSAGS